MDGKVLCTSYRTYSEQQILKISVQLAKFFSKYLFSTAKITRFEKTSFKLMATEIVKIKFYYLNIRRNFVNGKIKPRFFFQNFRLSPTLHFDIGQVTQHVEKWPESGCKTFERQPSLGLFHLKELASESRELTTLNWKTLWTLKLQASVV